MTLLGFFWDLAIWFFLRARYVLFNLLAAIPEPGPICQA